MASARIVGFETTNKQISIEMVYTNYLKYEKKKCIVDGSCQVKESIFDVYIHVTVYYSSVK